MPRMPEVFTAPIAEARRAREAEAESANEAVPYYEGILADEPDALVRSFAARQPVLDDPRVGRVEGTRELPAFVTGAAEWLRERDAVVENVAIIRTPARTVEEVVLNLLSDEGGRVELPVAIVTDRDPDRTLKLIRVYHSTWPLTGEHRVRPRSCPPIRTFTPRGPRASTRRLWQSATWRGSWRPSSPTATPASQAGRRSSIVVRRRSTSSTGTCSPTVAGHHARALHAHR
jgi:hypothetical protein